MKVFARRALIAAAAAAFVVGGALSVGCDRTSAPSIAVHDAALAAPRASACPDGMALVTTPEVCVDRYEAALVGWPYSHAVDEADGGAVPGASALRAAPAKGVMPQVNVSEVDAEAACARAGKRLCTAEEWTSACRGAEHLTYPYGDEHVDGACNDARPSPVAAGATAGEMARLDDPKLAEAPNGEAPGGAFPRCVTATGIYDMHGNVHEWVSTSPKPEDPRFGEFLGGFFADAKDNGAGCGYATVAHFKTYHDYSTGFRCCADPKR